MKRNKKKLWRNSGVYLLEGTTHDLESPTRKAGELPKFNILGYTGAPVRLSDYGFDHPMVYDIKTMKIRNGTPILYRHGEEIGHATTIRKEDSGAQLRVRGVASIPGQLTDKVVNGASNGFPYQASAGLDPSNAEITFLQEGTQTQLNNRTYVGPLYIARKTELFEMTVTPRGRDSDTTTVINEDEMRHWKKKREVWKNENEPSQPAPPNAAPSQPIQNEPSTPTPPQPAQGSAPQAPLQAELVHPATPPVAPPRQLVYNQQGQPVYNQQGQPVYVQAPGPMAPPQPIPAPAPAPQAQAPVLPAPQTQPQIPVYNNQYRPLPPVQPVQPAPQTLDNSQPASPTSLPQGSGGVHTQMDANWFATLNLLNQYPDKLQYIQTCIQNGFHPQQIQNALYQDSLEQQLRNTLPGNPLLNNEQQDFLSARLHYTLFQNDESLAKHFGEKNADVIRRKPLMSLREFMLEVGQAYGITGYTGHSDMDGLMNQIEVRNRQAKLQILNQMQGWDNSFSGFDMPNFFEKSCQRIIEEFWAIDDPCSIGFLREGSQNNFKPVMRMRPSGGEMWGRLKADGKIDHTSFGDEDYYWTQLDTIAQMITFKRSTVLNDEFDTISDLLEMMAEGAMMVPDYKWGKLLLDDDSDGFFIEGQNQITHNGDNLKDLLQQAEDLVYKKIINKGKKVWLNVNDSDFTLVHPCSMRREIWECLQQPTNCCDGSGEGEKNYFYQRYATKEFPQLENRTLFDNASDATWFLIPNGRQYMSHSITFLNGRRSPVVETVELSSDCLGFGVRGYWDLEVNERNNECIVRVIGNNTLSKAVEPSKVPDLTQATQEVQKTIEGADQQAAQGLAALNQRRQPTKLPTPGNTPNPPNPPSPNAGNKAGGPPSSIPPQGGTN